LDFDGKRNDIHYFNASPGALVSNYNTITVKINGDRSITVLDKHTPLTGGVKRRARGLPVGIQHFNVATNTEQSVMYTGELVKKIFVGYGAIFTGNVERGVLPKTVGKKLRYHSKPILTRVVRKMLRDSNNFIANQLLLAIVPKGQRRKISIGDGVRALSTCLINSVGLRADDFSIVEGSGLSKKNRIDVVAMLKILEFFRPHMDLLPALSTSRYGDLSRIGRKCDIRAKSGTLRDVSTLAGFIKMRDSSWKPFVIMLEDSKRSRGRAMETIYDYYRERHAIYCQ
jgi:D-alanyl-D-alanine carboxypeptidase/D-alanyl-D-alanine-endopeptidase (penicillin-binding protein 4)